MQSALYLTGREGSVSRANQMNEKQKEGMATDLGNLALGSLLGGIGGWFTGTFNWKIGLPLLILTWALYWAAFNLRKDGDKNAD